MFFSRYAPKVFILQFQVSYCLIACLFLFFFFNLFFSFIFIRIISNEMDACLFPYRKASYVLAFLFFIFFKWINT